MGDFQEPYGAIFGEFGKLIPLLLHVFGLKSICFERRDILRNF